MPSVSSGCIAVEASRIDEVIKDRKGWHKLVSTNFGSSPEDDLRKLKLM